ncbi:MAG: hypothetical protein RSB67_03310 [Clostridia bacterium]
MKKIIVNNFEDFEKGIELSYEEALGYAQESIYIAIPKGTKKEEVKCMFFDNEEIYNCEAKIESLNSCIEKYKITLIFDLNHNFVGICLTYIEKEKNTIVSYYVGSKRIVRM